MHHHVRKGVRWLICAGVAWIGTQGAAFAGSWTGTVSRIIDGDTMVVQAACMASGGSNASAKVRLALIDAPELAQPFGPEASQALASRVCGKVVVIDGQGRDRYGRIIGVVFIGGRDIGLELVRAGFAWAATPYAATENLRHAQDTARQAGLGLWHGSRPTPPWEFRRRQRESGTGTLGAAGRRRGTPGGGDPPSQAIKTARARRSRATTSRVWLAVA